MPGRISGRMSFGPRKPEQEQQQQPQQLEQGSARAWTAASTGPQGAGTSVSDVEMAKTFRKPAELAAWEPNSLRIYDSVDAGSGAGKGAGGGGVAKGSGQAGKAGGGGGGGGSKKGSGEGAAKGPKKAGKSEPAANSFAPLRPAKRPKQ